MLKLRKHGRRLFASLSLTLTTALLGAGAAHADGLVPNLGPGMSGRLVLTGGVSEIEGAAGGGLVPWAVIGGYGTGQQIGGSAYGTYVRTQDYGLGAYGAAVGLGNRLELSVARQTFDTRNVGPLLGLKDGFTVNQDIFGLKVRLIGDAVLD
ncbi:MAG TPA: DUF3034 family protein, partial [Paraburkholderia sp.]|nr:DUF3034 family protein [Paraburkholderia sp.]